MVISNSAVYLHNNSKHDHNNRMDFDYVSFYYTNYTQSKYSIVQPSTLSYSMMHTILYLRSTPCSLLLATEIIYWLYDSARSALVVVLA